MELPSLLTLSTIGRFDSKELHDEVAIMDGLIDNKPVRLLLSFKNYLLSNPSSHLDAIRASVIIRKILIHMS
jgi:hypothetical protein